MSRLCDRYGGRNRPVRTLAGAGHDVRHCMQGLLAVVLSVLVTSAIAQDGQDDGVISISTTVTGNQEQPKVMYIVPWQAATDDKVLDQPLESQMQEIFRHVERPEHTRELYFRQQMNQISE